MQVYTRKELATFSKAKIAKLHKQGYAIKEVKPSAKEWQEIAKRYNQSHLARIKGLEAGAYWDKAVNS